MLSFQNIKIQNPPNPDPRSTKKVDMNSHLEPQTITEYKIAHESYKKVIDF
jgi:hypothetical protein